MPPPPSPINKEYKYWPLPLKILMKYYGGHPFKYVSCIQFNSSLLKAKFNALLLYGWFPPATEKICWYWWKLQYCKRCHFLSWNKNFMKIFVHLIWVCKHLDIKFETKNQFRKYVKKISRNLINYLISGQFLTYLQNWFCSQI